MMQRPNIKRRVALAGGTALIAAAGVGGFLALSGGAISAHLTAAPTVQAPAAAAPHAESAPTTPDTDTLQQGDQSGVDTATAAAGTDGAAVVAPATAPTTAAGGEASAPEADAAGGFADAAGAAGLDGNFNN